MKKVHFIGIAGAGMSATAKLYKDKNWKVTGSDEECYPPMSDYLKQQKITYTIGYNRKNIPKDTDLIVLGRNTKLNPNTNEEVKAALESGIEIKSFPEVLANFSKKTDNIVVVGSYAKSTCTAMLTHCLVNANKNPSYFIGAIPIGSKETSKIGKDNTFIIEGDEYPASQEKNISKFLYLNVKDILLTAIEHDHVNVFPTIQDYLIPFKKLLKKIPSNGCIIACTDNSNVDKLIKKYKKKAITYGINLKKNPIWCAKNIKYGKISSFDLFKNKEKLISLKTTLLGKHNIQNIVGVSALLLEKKLLTPKEIKNGIKTFQGIKRRLEIKTKKSKVPVYDGFGSSYDKAKSAIEAIKTHYYNCRLVVIFEPHSFSWRNKAKLFWYDDVFKKCDKVFVCNPSTQGKNTHDQLTQKEIINQIKLSGVNTEKICFNTGIEKLKNYLQKTDVILLLSSGELEGLTNPIVNLVENSFSN